MAPSSPQKRSKPSGKDADNKATPADSQRNKRKTLKKSKIPSKSEKREIIKKFEKRDKLKRSRRKKEQIKKTIEQTLEEKIEAILTEPKQTITGCIANLCKLLDREPGLSERALAIIEQFASREKSRSSSAILRSISDYLVYGLNPFTHEMILKRFDPDEWKLTYCSETLYPNHASNDAELSDDTAMDGPVNQKPPSSIPPLSEARLATPRGNSRYELGLLAFERELPSLMEKHEGQWVAYHGTLRIGPAKTFQELDEIGQRLNVSLDECVYRIVEPDRLLEVAN